VSVKGVLIIDGGVVLLRNERDEWELPGGRVDPEDTSPRRRCAVSAPRNWESRCRSVT